MNLKLLAKYCAVIVLIISMTIMGSWAFNYSEITYLIPGAASMKFNTALGFFFLALSILVHSIFPKKISAFLAAPTFLLGSLTLSQFLFDVDLGIDNLFVRDLITPHFPGRPSPITSLCFIFCASAFLLASRFRSRTTLLFSQVLVALTFCSASRSFLGLVMGLSSFTESTLHTQMSIHTSISFLLCTVALVCLFRDKGLFPLIFARNDLGKLSRGFLFSIAVAVPMIQMLILLAEKRLGLNTEVAYSLFNVLGIALVCYIFFRYTYEVSVQIERRRSAEASLLLEKDQREKFINTLNHDLMTPLTAAKISVQILEKKFPSNDEKVYFSKIHNHLRRIESMVNDLLDMNSVQSGKNLPMNKTHCRLNDVIKFSLDGLRSIYGERFIFQESADIYGQFDAGNFQRVLENLCTNAVKYGEAERPIRVSLSKVSDMAVIDVKNEGNPIKQEDIDNIFNLFQRGEKSHTDHAHGWGIGLALVKEIVTSHQGTIEVTSSLSEGTIFRLKIPIIP